MDILFGRPQTPVFISFAVCGVLLGFVYDLFKVKRKLFGENAFVLFIDDFFFMMISALTVVFNSYAFNNGNMRFYEIPVMILFFAIYRKTLSIPVIKLCFFIVDVVKKLLRAVFNPIKKVALQFINFVFTLVRKAYLHGFTAKQKRKLLSICRL